MSVLEELTQNLSEAALKESVPPAEFANTQHEEEIKMLSLPLMVQSQCETIVHVPSYGQSWTTLHDIVSAHLFVEYSTLMRTLQSCRFKSFHDKASRDSIREAIGAIPTINVRKDTRFLKDVLLVDFTFGMLAQYISQMLDAMDYNETLYLTDKEERKFIIADDAKKSFSFALTNALRASTNVMIGSLSDNGIYNQATFEAKYQLVWS